MTEKLNQKRKSWKRRLLAAVVVLCALLLVGWFYVKGVVESRITSQLSELGLGQPKIEKVSVGLNGVSASKIEFIQPNAKEPWIVLEQLSIEHPLSGLAAGNQVYDGLRVDGLQIEVDLSADVPQVPFDFSTIDIPAKSLKLSNGAAVIRTGQLDDAGSPRKFSVKQINQTITKTKTGFEIEGTIGDLMGAEWTTVGSATPGENKFQIGLKTDSAKLVDGQWQNWPGLYSSVRKYFQADAEMAASLNLQLDEQSKFTYVADIDVVKGNLNLPSFNLPIKIIGGEMKVADGVVQFEKVVGTTDGVDSLRFSGSTTIDSFPVRTRFKADFRDLDVATLRKLASDIPVEVQGKVTGEVSGTVDVEESLRTTIALSSRGESSNASYAAIGSKSALVNVKLAPLVFDSQQNLDTIDGSVVVNANVQNTSAEEIFDSLDLADLAQQLEIVARASGDVRLELPLATASEIKTWKMDVSATSAEGTFSQQSIKDIRVKANLANGSLHFNEIVATPVLGSGLGDDEPLVGVDGDIPLAKDSSIRASIVWPLTSTSSQAEVGKLNFEGEQVALPWLIGLIDRQVKNASGEGVRANSATLSGSVNFQTQIEVDANDPSNIKKWQGKGSVKNSIAIAGGQRMENLKSNLILANGELEYSQLAGEFSTGGKLNGNGKLDLLDGTMKAANIHSTEMPLSWVASVAADSIPDVKLSLKKAGFDLENLKDDLVGNLSARLELEAATQNQPWAIATQIESNQLQIKGETLNSVLVSGKFDANNIKIENAQAELNGGGRFDLSGDWLVAKQTGQANLKWQRLPLNWLASFGTSSGELFEGSTSGELELSRNLNAINDAIPVSMEGTIRADGLRVAGLNARELAFDVRTEESAVLLDRFRSEGDLKEVDIKGRIELMRPFTFSVDGSVERLPLLRIFERPSLADKFASIPVSGNVSGKVNLTGDLVSLNWNSNGEARLSNLNYNNQAINDIDAKWNHNASDWKASSVKVNAFGGTLEMVELSGKPERIKVTLKDIDSKQLTSVTTLPGKVTGKISGDASLNDWSLASTRWADLNIRGASVLVGSAEFGDLLGSAEFRNEALKYSVDGRFLNGRITAKGETKVSPDQPLKSEIPVNVQFTNGALAQLYRKSNNFRSLRSLEGNLSANADLVFRLDSIPTGTGVFKINNLAWGGEVLTKEVSTNVSLNSGSLVLNNLRADLRRGEISGRASIPITSNASGNYQLDFRSFDLQRLLDVVMDDPIEGAGLMDARVSGQIGRTITGQGSIALNQAKILGLVGRTFRVPVQFQYQPSQNSGRIAFRDSRFQVFNGNVSGSASLDFGRTVSLNTKLKVAKLDTELLFGALGRENAGQGKLSGQLTLKGSSIRSLRDLKGEFTGSLERAAAFELPLLNEVGRFLGGNQLQARDFESNDIDLRLSQGKIEVRRLNFSNSLAQIAITGNAFVDGRLDLNVAGKIDRLNQPTLIEQLAGSPLTRLGGSSVELFTQAADFLSERLVFVQIGGTFKRPIVRPDTGKQLQSETIRYFLRGSQIFPNSDTRNN